LSLKVNSTILFQGDSITDAGRKRNHSESLGDGYVMLTAAWLSALYPEYHLKFVNRGVGGDGIRDLKNRWKKDCLDLKPDLVSILVGVNDVTWRGTSTESFEADYVSILEQTRQLRCQIVLLEPFLLPLVGDFLSLTEELTKKIDVVRKLANEFKIKSIPLNDIFLKACLKRDASFWSLDGAHPTLAGHALIAQSWIKSVMNEP
jgi:acyl-CoA thioesterase I